MSGKRTMGGYTTRSSGSSSSLQGQIDKMYSAARQQYAPGGGFEKGVQGQLARTEQKAMSAGMQNLVSSGMAGTTMAGGLGNKFAEEVAAPTLMQMESNRAQGIAGVYQQQAGTYAQMEQMRQQQSMQASAQSDALRIAMAQLGLQKDEAKKNREHQSNLQHNEQWAQQTAANRQSEDARNQAARDRMRQAQQGTGQGGVQAPQPPHGQQASAGGVQAFATMSDGTQFVMGDDGFVRRM